MVYEKTLPSQATAVYDWVSGYGPQYPIVRVTRWVSGVKLIDHGWSRPGTFGQFRFDLESQISAYTNDASKDLFDPDNDSAAGAPTLIWKDQTQTEVLRMVTQTNTPAYTDTNDWFKFSVVSGETYRVSVTNNIIGVNSTNAPRIAIYGDTNGTTVIKGPSELKQGSFEFSPTNNADVFVKVWRDTVTDTNILYTLNYGRLPKQSAGFRYSSDGSVVTITGYTGTVGRVTLTNTIEGLPVTGIGDLAFYNCPGLVGVTLPAGVTNIGHYAFTDCTGLTSVFFTTNAPTLGADVFYNATNATVYRQDGAGGWPVVPGTWGGRPTALWGEGYVFLTVNGGAGEGSYTNGQQVAIAAYTPASGWIFDQWTGTTQATQCVNSVTSANTTVTMPALDITLTAGLKGLSYTVTYNTQGGLPLVPPTNRVTFGSAYGPLPTPARAGYTFKTWKTQAGTLVTAATLVTTAADHTLYAEWTAKTCIVTFDVQGGTPLVVATNYVMFGSAYGTLPTPVRMGYTFKGWWTEKEGGGKQVVETTLVERADNHSLYAKWSANSFKVTFDAQGGVTPEPAWKSVTNGLVYGTLPIPVRTGYTFRGWWTEKEGRGTQVNAATEVSATSDHTLFAKWSAKISTVTFDAQGGTSPMATNHVTFGLAYGALPVPVRTGFNFVGWWTLAGGAGTQVFATTIVSATTSHTLYAKWAARSYTVTFDAQGGMATVPAAKSVTNGLAYGTLPTPVKAGYAFKGWWTKAGGEGAQVTAATTVSSSANHTLYAAWAANETVDWTATVGVAFEIALSDAYEGAATITVKGLPPGLKFSAAGRTVSGVPTKAGEYPVTVSARDRSNRVFKITVTALPVWAQGTFNGYVKGGGLASMTISTAGTISGKIAMSGTNYSFSAKSYTAGGDPTNGVSVTTSAKAGRTSLPLVVVMKPATSPQTLGTGTGTFGGLPVVLYRNVWKDSGLALVADKYDGYYTATLPGNSGYGSGYLMFTLDKSGKVKTAGKLSDGTSVSQAGTLILDETGRVFTVVYAAPTAYKGGCVFGLAEFVNPVKGSVYLNSLDNAPFLWVSRNPQATSDYSKGGFNRQLGITGGWYSKTENLYGYYRDERLEIGTAAGVPVPMITAGTLREPSDWWNPDGIALTVVTNKAGVMTGITAPKAGVPVKNANGSYDYTTAQNTLGLKLSLTLATGVFKGAYKAWFDYSDKHTSKSIIFEGALTPVRKNMDDFVGRGFFLWADKSLSPAYTFNWSYDFLLLSVPAP